MRGVQRRKPPAGRVARPGRHEPVERMDRELLRVLDRGFERAARSAGDWLRCGPGCSDCCHGPFPITRLDVRRLAEGWHDLLRSEPARAREIGRRARDAVAILSEAFPGRADTGRLGRDERVLDRYLRRHRSMACPALDPATGRCELYAARPVACRTYGPPLRFENEEAASCPLCFVDADPETIGRCRFEPDPDGCEEAILDRLGVAAGEEWETLIAFALARLGADQR